MALNKNLVIEQGITFSANIQHLDDNKIPISLAGYTTTSQMRKSYNSANTSAVFTSSIVDSANGNVNIYLEAATTAALTPARYVYDINANIGNVVVRIAEGIVTVNPGVTK